MKRYCIADSFVAIMIFVGAARQAVRCVRSFSLRNTGIHQRKYLLPVSFRIRNLPIEDRYDQSTTTRLFYTPFPENLYREWTLEDDRLLWKNRSKPPSELGVMLGRGVRGVEKRIEKLKDVESAAYQRLFVGDGGDDGESDETSDTKTSKTKKMVPSFEVLRRIEWDYQLNEQDFRIMHYDRVDDTLVVSPLTAPNENISSGETSLIKALPEHRIVAILYKERVVWDRRNNRKHDVFFGSPGILDIVETYNVWKEQKDAQRKEQKLLQVAWQERWLELLLGSETEKNKLVHFTKELLEIDQTYTQGSPHQVQDEGSSTITLTNDQQQKLDGYIQNAFEIFRVVESNRNVDNDVETNNNVVLVSLFDELSEWVASPCWSSFDYDDVEDEAGSEANLLRETLLRKLSSTMDKLEGKTTKAVTQTQQSKKESANQQNQRNQKLKQILLNEDDIEETFVRGSGAGGQKINKTSNRVVLLHRPSGVRVECQETRSLQQNRKIGRKRLLEKLDSFYHGTDSKEQQKQQKAQSKKKKTKSKNKARLAAKQEAKRQKKTMLAKQQEDEDEFPF